MNNSDGFIYVDYGQVEGSVEDMVTQSQAIESIINELNMELQELQNSWIGDDKEVYGQVQANWNQAVSNIRSLLAQHGNLLEDISANYRSSEQSGAQRWGEIRIGSR